MLGDIFRVNDLPEYRYPGAEAGSKPFDSPGYELSLYYHFLYFNV